MPQIAPIVIYDGSATPVAYTFSPIGKDEKGVQWFEQTTPTPANLLGAYRIGYKQVRIPGSDAKGSTKAVYTFSVPTLETPGGTGPFVPPPTVAYVEKGRIELDTANRSTTQEKKHLRAFMWNFLATAMAIANIDMSQPSY